MERDRENKLGRSLKYLWVYEKISDSIILSVIKHSLSKKPIAEVLAKRQILTEAEIENYISTPLKALINPFLFRDMDKAVKRIYSALINNESICIYGDYDVDGVSATALLYSFFSDIGLKSTYYIPNRLEEGYGLNHDAIDEISSKGIDIIITVDCGITASKEITYAKTKGVDVIVTDHHQPGDEFPKDAYAVINPVIEGETYPFKCLSGVGVAFKLVMAFKYYMQNKNHNLSDIPNLKKYLDIVTLGTIADVVPLVGENRIFVKHGLKLLSEGNNRYGIDELKKITGLSNTNITTMHVGFNLAPRINAVGRLGSSDRGVKLLTTKNKVEARWLAEELDIENKYRQNIERKALKQSFEKIEKNGLHKKYKGIVLYSDEWHPGIIGIVASRVVEKYFKPTIVVTLENGIGKGSARSIPSFHLYDCLKEMSDLLIGYGGHKYAAGIKVELSNLKLLQKRFHSVVETYFKQEEIIPEIVVDTNVEPEDIDSNLVKWIEMMKPFGAGNSEPVFCMKRVKKYQNFAFIGKDKGHLKGFVEKNNRIFDIIGYNMKDYEKYLSEGDLFDILFIPEYNNWMGNENIQLKIKDIKRSI